LFGSTPSGLTTETDWQCFRYRSSTTVVPLRNLWTGAPAT
jgi:hypothetical protein